MNSPVERFLRERSFFGATARERVAHLFDAGSVREFLPPQASAPSPHLARLGMPGRARRRRDRRHARRSTARRCCSPPQEGQFMGGAVGELHGAKMVGVLARARRSSGRAAVLLLIDSGGVRLHEANAGLIAISEIMRARARRARRRRAGAGAHRRASAARSAAWASSRGCARASIMSEEGRLALSGPDVIETVAGVEEFDARDRALVWRVTGGKHRLLMGDCDELVDDDIGAFRDGRRAGRARGDRTRADACAICASGTKRWRAGRERFAGLRDGAEAWPLLGVADPHAISMLTAGRDDGARGRGGA